MIDTVKRKAAVEWRSQFTRQAGICALQATACLPAGQQQRQQLHIERAIPPSRIRTRAIQRWSAVQLGSAITYQTRTCRSRPWQCRWLRSAGPGRGAPPQHPHTGCPRPAGRHGTQRRVRRACVRVRVRVRRAAPCAVMGTKLSRQPIR